jgi:ornithine decarboxylase
LEPAENLGRIGLAGLKHGHRESDLPTYPSADAALAELKPSDPVFCIDASKVRSAARRFATSFPGRVLYAVKCNPHPLVLSTLYNSGVTDFDVASLEEARVVNDMFRGAAGIYFNNPAKSRPAIRSASRELGIRFYTVDHISELEKIIDESAARTDVVVSVRLATTSRSARYALSTKFGAPPDEAVELLVQAHRAQLGTGIAFHVGSQCLAPEAFGQALRTCRDVIRRAGVPVRVLNVGGGFPAPYPGDHTPILEEYFASIIFGQKAMELAPGCLLLCEPGRSLVASAGSVIVQVLLRRDDRVYLNDGVFGNLQELRHPKERRPARIVGRTHHSQVLNRFKTFGPTCDSDDVLGAPLMLPDDIREGDWIEIGMMGAYSLALRTEFNGFYPRTVVSIDGGSDSIVPAA